MAAARKRMGFDGQIYYGAAGATASQLMENIQDVSYNFEFEEGDTTERGDGSAPPIGEGEGALRRVTIEFGMHNKDNDTILEALLTAMYAGTPVALRLKDKAAGKGFDGDVILSNNHDQPLSGSQTYAFSARPNGRLRKPQLYV